MIYNAKTSFIVFTGINSVEKNTEISILILSNIPAVPVSYTKLRYKSGSSSINGWAS